MPGYESTQTQVSPELKLKDKNEQLRQFLFHVSMLGEILGDESDVERLRLQTVLEPGEGYKIAVAKADGSTTRTLTNRVHNFGIVDHKPDNPFLADKLGIAINFDRDAGSEQVSGKVDYTFSEQPGPYNEHLPVYGSLKLYTVEIILASGSETI